MIGKLFEVGGASPYRHPKVWIREPTPDGPERLRIGAGEGALELLKALAAPLREPLFLLVVMRAPRVVEAGRWESIALTHPELARFTDRYGELFEQDARAQLWVGELDGVGMLVLDEHDLIYAYGPLHRFEQTLRERDYAAGDPQVPSPHEHHYNERFDKLESDLRRLWAWNRILPLDAVPED